MMTATGILQSTFDGPIPREAWADANKADAQAFRRKTARVQRLGRIYDRAALDAIGSTDGHKLATATLAHWLFALALDGGDYDAEAMRDDLLATVAKATTYSRRIQWAARILGG